MFKKLVIILSLIFFSAFSDTFDHKNYSVNLKIKNFKTNQIHNFQIFIANDSISRQKGLMFVTNLPEKYAMLFEFENPQVILMWMKNTKIPLDMIFINEEGKIIRIEKQAIPESLHIISSKNPAQKVLEINGGLTEKLGIQVGDLVEY